MGPLLSTRHFDICGPLPGPGVTVLEASAGTGKTFTIAGLVARTVAEGLAPLSQILVVTFTRMATGTLRDRVRARLVSAEAGLGRMLDVGEEPPPGDSVLARLGGDGAGPAAERRARLARALADFDSATITTTHGFCHMMLNALGVWGDVAPGAALLEDPEDMVEEVVDDLLARHALVHGTIPLPRREALQAGLEVVRNPGVPLGPPADRGDVTASGWRRRLAQGVRGEVGRRLLDANLLTYDDLLVRLANALQNPRRGAAACARLRRRYAVVLVDEFQDTDPVQWQVVKEAFGVSPPVDDGSPRTGSTRLVLVGDPKQAVYAFRGADVHSYLDAVRAAGPRRHFTLELNWRSDAALLEAYDAFFGPLHLGHPEIIYRRVRATPPHTRPGLSGAPSSAALRVRLVPGDDRGLVRTGERLVQKDSAVRWIADDLAGDVVSLLAPGAELVAWKADDDVESTRPLSPSDIGVLVRTNRQAVVVQAALRRAGVPVVVAGAQSVFSTPAARDWLRLLEALEQPASRSRAAAAALTPFVGLSADQLAVADEGTWEAVHSRLYLWAAVARSDGAAGLFGHISASESLPARLLAETEGERRLTDLAHVAELLHAEAMSSQLGLAALRTWLAYRGEEPGTEATEADQRSRRLESAEDAVHILTVHRAKGMEFPIVYCPYLWDNAPSDRPGAPVMFHDAQDGGRRKLDVGEKGDATYQRHLGAGQEERRGEDLRHLYVALTRAKHQTVVWWAAVKGCQHSALGRLLLAKDANGDVAGEGRRGAPADREVWDRFQEISAAVPGLVSVERATGATARGWAGPGQFGRPAELSTAPFDRRLDVLWRRSSYTSITAPAHEASSSPGRLVSSEPEEPGTVDEPGERAPGPLAGAHVAETDRAELTLRAVPCPLAAVPGGADIGTFVHGVLEAVDFAASDLRAELAGVVRARADAYPGSPGDTECLVEGLEAALLTPMGDLTGGVSLAGIARRDRLDELGFELPLVGGDEPVGEVTTDEMAALFARHLGTGGPLAGYAATLAGPALSTRLRGYLTGSLDLVFRLGGKGREERYFVVDYKTNWLGPPGEELCAWHYRRPALEEEMCLSHYVLQAAFYLVALHRYLRWRLPAYDPAVHLGGAVYLFLRGMTGPVPAVYQGQPCGVFAWRPPVQLVTELSDLFSGPSATATASGAGPGRP
jgi:exodeoxyribonuclease V beta subunit